MGHLKVYVYAIYVCVYVSMNIYAHVSVCVSVCKLGSDMLEVTIAVSCSALPL